MREQANIDTSSPPFLGSYKISEEQAIELNRNKEYSEATAQRIWSEARSLLGKEAGGHSLQHSERVFELCLRIAKEEGKGDQDVLQAAAILHDIAIPTSGRKCHAEKGKKIAEKILRRVGFPEEKTPRVLHAIETHRFSDKKTPGTWEAKILQDADRLDAIGAIGIARCFAFGGRENRPLYDPTETPGEYDPERTVSSLTHVQEKLMKVKHTLHTATARRIAEDRHNFMLEFIERLTFEIDGKK